MAERPRALIAGNWKMNGLAGPGLAEIRKIARKAKAERPACDVLVCPPATLLAAAARALGEAPVHLGAQDCHAAASGAHTGDISAEMLADVGCSYVIVGHSERRRDHGESDVVVRAKAAAAHRAGLVAIVCVGETRADRDAGQALAVVERQLAESLPQTCAHGDSVVAYEPVWAIGTGLTPTPEDITEMHATIRRRLVERFGRGEGARMRILYGGSVKGSNAGELLAVPNVDGALVGGASLIAAEFWPIVAARAAG
jgi:triosephosphate isomerase (TIM)